MPTEPATTPPPIAVVGPGAVGGLLAALLARAGAELVVVARETSARRIAAEGITVESSRFGAWRADVATATRIPTGARVILATKAEAIPRLAIELAAAKPVEVVSVLNGLEHVEVLRAAAPGIPIVGASIAVEALRLAPTVVAHRSPFLRVVVPAESAGLTLVAALRDAGIDVSIGGPEHEVLWTKLRFLAPHALLTSLWSAPIGEALERDPALTRRLLDEIAAVASAEGVPTTGAELAGILGGMPGAMRSSLQADTEAGRPGELDAIGGAVRRRADRHGLDVPALRETIALIEASARRAGAVEAPAEVVTLCCLLWARDGDAAGLAAYEDRVLALLPEHAAELVQRARGDGADGRPHEVQLFRFPSQLALDGYLADPRRTALAVERDRVVERTELFPVTLG